ncbi:MAG: hypothetical protein AUJ72_03400 [Candidatus Omnitrophica bacterium CG1_02_46_14]|nr:MAG: hypothetical protein AUJ72_03400 [Candidatus Omnitrophica bacterium CG1_02_46_14]
MKKVRWTGNSAPDGAPGYESTFMWAVRYAHCLFSSVRGEWVCGKPAVASATHINRGGVITFLCEEHRYTFNGGLNYYSPEGE